MIFIQKTYEKRKQKKKMWKKVAILILTLQICDQISAKSIYRGNHNGKWH